MHTTAIQCHQCKRQLRGTEFPLCLSVSSAVFCFLGFDDFAAAQAGRADAHALSGRADFGVHGAQVDVPAPLADVVRVADRVAALSASCRKSDKLVPSDCSPDLLELGVQNTDCTGFERVLTSPPTGWAEFCGL